MRESNAQTVRHRKINKDRKRHRDRKIYNLFRSNLNEQNRIQNLNEAENFDVTLKCWAAAMAPWFHLRLPSCVPGFENQARHLRFLKFVLLKLLLQQEKNENKQKRCRYWPIFKKH